MKLNSQWFVRVLILPQLSQAQTVRQADADTTAKPATIYREWLVQ